MGSMTGGSNAWAAASVCSTVVLALIGAVGRAYVHDQARIEARVRVIEEGREAEAEERGRTAQRLDHLGDLAERNESAIRDGLTGLDTTLQREMRLLDAAMQEQLNELDRRLQSEVATVFAEHRARLEGLRTDVNRMLETAWTRADQVRYEDMRGLRLEPRATEDDQ